MNGPASSLKNYASLRVRAHTQAGVRECAPFVEPQYTSYTPSASSHHIYDPLLYHSSPIPKELATGASQRSWLLPVVYTPFCFNSPLQIYISPSIAPSHFWSNVLYMVYLHLYVSLMKKYFIYVLLTYTQFFREHNQGVKTRPWCNEPNKSSPPPFLTLHSLWPIFNIIACLPSDLLLCVWLILVKGKGKAVPLQAWSGPKDSRKLRFPTAQDSGKVVSLTHRPSLPTENAPGTHFC